MTAVKVRLILGLNALAAVATFTLAVYPLMNHYGLVDHPQLHITVQYTADGT